MAHALQVITRKFPTPLRELGESIIGEVSNSLVYVGLVDGCRSAPLATALPPYVTSQDNSTSGPTRLVLRAWPVIVGAGMLHS